MEISTKSLKGNVALTVALALLLGLSMNVSAVTYYTAANGTPSTLANWWTATNGTGTHPANFTTAGDIFIIQNTMTTTGNWTVTGTVTINSGGTLAVTSTGTTMNLGSFIINSGGIATINRPLTVTGTTTISGTINFGSTSTKARVMTFSGDVTLNSTAIWNEPSTGNGAIDTYSFAGNFVNNALSFNAFGTGIHTFSGTTRTFSGSTITSIGSVTVTGTRTNSGTLTVRTSLAGAGTLTNGNGTTGTLNLGGTTTITTLTATAANNLVNYTGAAQTAKVATYNNLTLSGSLTKTFATTPTVNGILSLEGTASVVVTTGVVTYGASATLQYNKAASYTATTEEWITPFVASGGIIIKNTGAITTPGAVQIGNNTNVPLNINIGATLTPGSNLITLHGDFINAGTLTSGSGGVTIAGTATPQAIDGFTTTGTVTMTKTAGTATFDGNVNGGPLTINGSGGTLNLGSGLKYTFTGTWTRTNGTLDGGSSTIFLTAATAVSGTGGTFTPGSGTVNYSGTAQTAGVLTYNNLTLSGSGNKTFSTTPTVNGILSMEGTAAAVVTSGVITYGAGATLQYNKPDPYTATAAEWITPFAASGGVIIANTGTITMNEAKVFNSTAPLTIQSGSSLAISTFLLTLNSNLINNGGTTTGSGGVTITGSATQSIGSFTNTGTVLMTKTGGTATLTGNVNGAGLTINGSGGTLNLGDGLTHTFSGDVTLTAGLLNGGNSTLNENNASVTAWNGTGSVFTPADGTVNFGASGNQTIAANSSFWDLTLSGSGNKTFSNSKTIGGTLDITGALADLAGITTHTAKSLTFGGIAQAGGSWGSTSSTATNQNNTYFVSGTNGLINVDCQAPSAPTSGGTQTICSGETIPALSVTVGTGETAYWYAQASGGTALAGPSLTYTPGSAGTYYAGARSASGCASATRTAVTLTINPIPAITTTGTASVRCYSATSQTTTLDYTATSGTPTSYSIDWDATANSAGLADQGTTSFAFVPGGGSLTGIAITSGTTAGTFSGTMTITNINTCSGTHAVTVTISSLPAALTLTGGTICASPGGNGTISSSTSVSGINYQLYNSGNAAVQSAQPGTGSGLLWSNLDAGTGYYVIATSASTSCVSSNSNAVNVTAAANPTALVLTGSTVCASPGGNGTISSSTSQAGVDYQLFDNTDTEVQTLLPGTGSGLTWSGLPAGTGYYVVATDATYDCVSSNSNAVNITTTANPVVTNFSASAATACGGNGSLVTVSSTSLASGTYTVTYSVSGTNTIASTTASMNFTSGSPGTGTFTTANLSIAGSSNVVHITSVTLASTGCSSTVSASTASFTTNSSGAWSGGVSSSWSNPANWCGGTLPTSSTNIVLSGTPSNWPNIDAVGAVCNSITIGSGATLTITGSNTLNISDNWTLVSGGIFTANSSTVNFNGTSAQTISGVTTFSTLQINNASGVNLGAAITVSTLTIGNSTSGSVFSDGGNQVTSTGTLNLTSGTFKLGAATATTFPAFSAAVNITAGTTVEYAATATQTIKGITYSNLTISGSGTNSKKADGNITVNGILNLSSANASATQGCLEMTISYTNYPGTTISSYLNSYILYMGATATTIGPGDVTGTVTRNTIVANTPYTFGHQYTTVSLTAGTMPSSLSVTITIGNTTPGPVSGTDIIRDAIKRTYEIVPANNASGSYVTANFHYLHSELTSSITSYLNSELKMTTMDYDIDAGGHGASASDEHGRANFDYSNNYIGLSSVPIAYFIQVPTTHEWRTIFTLRDFGVGYFTWDGSESTDWNTALNWTLAEGGAGVPTPTGHVIIPNISTTNNRSPVLPAGITTINTLSIENGGILVMGSNTLTIQNTFSGGWEDQNPAGNDPGTSIVIFNRFNTTVSGYARFYNVQIVDGADITNQSGSSIKIAGSITKTGSFTGKWYADVFSNTVDYNGSGAQTVLMPDGSSAYWNLTLSGSGAKTLPGPMALKGNFTMGNSATATATGALAVSGDVIIGSGTTFNASSYSHLVSGNWTNNGSTFTPGTSTITFNNTAADQAINGSAASQTFNDVVINKSTNGLSVEGITNALTVNNLTLTTGNFTSPATFTVNGNTTITAGTFTTGSFVFLKGNLAHNGGVFATGSGTVTFNGSSAQSIGGMNTFNNLTINNSAGVTGNANQTVNGVLDLLSANASNTQGCLNMSGSSELIMGSLATTTGTGDVTGIVRRTSFTLNTPYSFGNQYTTINFTAGTIPTVIQVKIVIGTAPTWKPDAIKRVYEVIRTGGDATTFATLNLHYLTSELNGNTEANIVKYGWELSGGIVSEVGRTAYDLINHWSGQSNFHASIWHQTTSFGDRQLTLANASTTNTKTWYGLESTDWTNQFNWTPNGEPTVSNDVIIPDAATTNFDPIVTDKSVKTITIQTGGLISASPGTTLTIAGGNGAWLNHSGSSAFSAGTGTVLFTNASASLSGSSTFNNLTIDASAILTIGSGTATMINGALTIISGGILEANYNTNTIDYSGATQTVIIPNGTNPGYSSLILSGSGTFSLPGSALQISGDLTLSGSVTATPTTYPISVTGTTTIGGTSNLILGAAELLSDAGPIIMNGGTFTTGASTGYSETVGTLRLTDTSFIVLGSGAHSLTFAASNLVPWENGKTLTITGWTGSNGASGTAGKIFAGTSGSGLTASQLTQIKFDISPFIYEASILPTGEIVPAAANTWSWNGASDRTWTDPANWTSTDGSAPSDGSNVIIYSGVNQPQVTTSITCNNLTITSGVLTISSTGRLAVIGTLTNSIGTTGLLIQSSSTGDGMLLNGTSSVPATVELFLTGGGGNSYHFIVPPVSSFNIGSDISSVINSLNTQYFNGDLMDYDQSRAGYNQNNGWSYFDGYIPSGFGYANDPFNSLTSAQAYNIYLTASDKITFTGTLNSTPHITFPLNRTTDCVGWNLIGNPYPCYYDLTGISELATAGNGIDKTVYFYHEGVYEYHNLTSGAGTGNYASTHIVPPMQGFFVHVTTAASPQTRTISLPGGSYKSVDGTTPRSKGYGSVEASSIQKVRLVLSNPTQSDETIVCLTDKATSGFDSDYDGYKMFGSNTANPFIYTELNAIKYSINSLQGPVSEPVIVPLTVEIKSQGNYKIDITEFENLDGINVFLKHGAIETLLSSNTSYSFTSAPGTFTDFHLIFGGSVTGIEKPATEKLKTWYSNNFLYINCPAEITTGKGNLIIFDMQGKPVYNNIQLYLIPGQTIQLPVNLSKGVYVTHVTINNQPFVSKIVVL